MDFTLTDEHRALQQMARDFAEKEIRPISAERDLIPDPRETFDWEIIKKGSALGLRTIAVPERLGGPGVDRLGQVLVILELARADGAIAKSFSQNWKFTPFLTELANDEQRERFLPAFLENDTFMLASAGTEPDAGSDNRMPPDDPNAGYRTSAVRDGDDWVINGMKHFIANGGVASLYFTLIRTDFSVPVNRGTTMLMVPSDTPGFSIGRTHNKIGWRFYQNAELIYENCRVPDANRLLEVNEGRGNKRMGIASFNDEELSANALGIAQAAFEHALEHARNRVQGGKPIIEHHLIGSLLLEMFTRLEASRTMMWRSATSIDNGGSDDPKLARATKVMTVNMLNFVTTRAVEIWGGMGVMREAPIEKIYRDAIQLFHMGNTNQVNMLKAMDDL